MAKYKVGDMVEIIWDSPMWAGKRKVVACDYTSVTVKNDSGAEGLFYLNCVRPLKITNWKKRIR
jgi:hypothetical protein